LKIVFLAHTYVAVRSERYRENCKPRAIILKLYVDQPGRVRLLFFIFFIGLEPGHYCRWVLQVVQLLGLERLVCNTCMCGKVFFATKSRVVTHPGNFSSGLRLTYSQSRCVIDFSHCAAPSHILAMTKGVTRETCLRLCEL